MRLRQRLILILGITSACLVLVLCCVSTIVFRENFNNLETQEVLKSVSRAKNGVDQTIADLHSKSSDWAIWDDSYKFMEDHNKPFIESNLTTVNLKVDIITFIDLQGKIFHSKSFDRQNGAPLPDAEALRKTLHFDRPSQNRPGKGDAFSGLVWHQGMPLSVSVRPILPSSQKGTPRGWLIFGAYFNRVDARTISRRLQLDINLLSINRNENLSKEDKAAFGALSPKNEISTFAIDGHRVAGITLVNDLDHRPVALLKTVEPRDIYAQGEESLAFLTMMIAFAGLAFSLITLLVIERAIAWRLTSLSKQVDEVTEESQTRDRVEPLGSDEIGALGRKINEMLASLELSTEKVRRSEDKLRLHSETLERTILERTKEVEHLAYHDKLTGLPNRALLMDRIDLALKKGFRTERGTATMFIDLDNFKLINDSLGHSYGDELLIAFAQILVESVRPGDSVARMGGDEFTILFEDLEDVETAEEVAKRILAALRKPILLGNRETFAGASIGIAYSIDQEMRSDMLMKNSDTAMYRAKASGKSNYVVYNESMDDHALDRFELETHLRRALDNSEIYVEYQPLVDLNSNMVIGAEALARWQHPERGLVSPGEFIPIAEDTGVIVPIGYWILEKACHQAKLWIVEHNAPDFIISVNLSGKQLQREDVIIRVKDILDRTGLAPCQLKLEITETTLMEDSEDIIEKMEKLKALGILLALDDFGTGYSSLSTLRSFPIDTLKIDRAFISRLGEEESALAIVEAILGLARTMRMDVTGEGVENQAQQDIIRDLGCQVGQGYFFAQPLSSENFGLMLAKSTFEEKRNKAA